MKCNVLRKLSFFAALFLSLARMTTAQGGNCSIASAAGVWGHTIIGTIFTPVGAAVPTAAVGISTFDAAGNFTGSQTSSTGGIVIEDKIKGTLTLNPDCTGTLTTSVFDQSSTLLRTAVWNLVVVDNGREVRAIFKSLALPNGTPIPAVITVEVKRVDPGRAHNE